MKDGRVNRIMFSILRLELFILLIELSFQNDCRNIYFQVEVIYFISLLLFSGYYY